MGRANNPLLFLNMNMQVGQSHQVRTAVAVGNLIDLTFAIVNSIAGNDISDQLNGAPMTREGVGQLVIADINSSTKYAQG